MDIINFNNRDYYVTNYDTEKLECHSVEKYNPFSVEKCKYYKTFDILVNEKIYDNDLIAFNDKQAGKMFNDEVYMKNILKMFELYRRILRYAYDNNAYVDKYNFHKDVYCISFYGENYFDVVYNPEDYSIFDILFNSEDVARKCIDDIIRPFLSANKMRII